jgi:putative endonuclease
VSRGASGRPDHEHQQARPSPGTDGVEAAARWYEEQGYEILERHWRRREGEVDLVARQGATVVFIEVMVQVSEQPVAGADAILPAKQRRVRRLGSRWLSELTPAVGRNRIELRFDVATVTSGTVTVVEDAF